MFTRLLNLPQTPTTSYFLWGPRQSGKTTLLKKVYPQAFRIDLLKSDSLIAFLREPWRLREQIQALPPKTLVVIDEIQKVPALLDEIHFLIEEQKQVFVLCGSSARKLKRGHANMLGGRALKYELLGLSMFEIGKQFSLSKMLNTGPIPNHYLHDQPTLAIRSYIDTYLREEILAESLVRNLPVFSDFLRVAAIGDTEIVNLTNISSECGVSQATVRDHYNILVDTLLGAFLPAYTRRAKRRTIQASKFYFRDIGVVNQLAQRGEILEGSTLFGKAFENWLFNELSIHCRYRESFYDISYWRLTTGVKVDFVLGDAKTAIEAKGKKHITSSDYKGLLQFKEEHPEVENLLIVCLEEIPRKTDHGISILPYQEFIRRLWAGEYQ